MVQAYNLVATCVATKLQLGGKNKNWVKHTFRQTCMYIAFTQEHMGNGNMMYIQIVRLPEQAEVVPTILFSFKIAIYGENRNRLGKLTICYN